jgi:hypothetical protein
MRGWWVGLVLATLVALGYLAVDWMASAAWLGGAAAVAIMAGPAQRLTLRLPLSEIRRMATIIGLAAAIVLCPAVVSVVEVVVLAQVLTAALCSGGCVPDVAQWALLGTLASLVLTLAGMAFALVAIGRSVRAVSWLRQPAITGVVVTVSATVALILSFLVGSPLQHSAPPARQFTDYTLEVRPSPPGSAADFDVVAKATYAPLDPAFGAPRQLQLGTRHVRSSTGPGLLVREAALPGPDDFSPVTLPVSGGEKPEICFGSCPPVTVEFVDLPRGSVWEVRHGTIDRREPFGDSELVLASITPIDGGDIVFSYLPEPYNFLPQPAITLAVDSSNAPKLLVAAVAAMAVAAWRAGLAALRSAAAKRFAEMLLRRRPRQTDERCTSPSPPNGQPSRAPRRRTTGRPPRR